MERITIDPITRLEGHGKIEIFLDDEGNFFDTVHFSDSLNRYPFRGKGVYLILGKVVEEFGFPSVEVQKLARLEYRADPRY